MNKIITISIFLSLVFVIVFSGSHFACTSGDPPQAPFQPADAQVIKDMKKNSDQKGQSDDQLTPKKDDGVEEDQGQQKDQFIDVVPSDAYVDVLASDGA